MKNYNQILIRIKSFLNSTDLTDSQTAQELYNAFLELNNSIVQRLIECDVLLQKKQKIEAVVLAKQSPNLFNAITDLLFEDRKTLLILADLYDWKVPDEIPEELIKGCKEAVLGMDALQPLLTEFRRIARTDQIEYKLHLLREIHRIDKDNPEWIHPLNEVENKYLAQLIQETQQVIINKDFERLEQIYEEFSNSSWTVVIPSIVLQKVEKIVTQHRDEEIKKNAKTIIEKINSAYSAYDCAALEDAILCWTTHCEKYNYIPNDNEALNIKEACAYFTEHKEQEFKEQEHQLKIDYIVNLINTAAPLLQVEKIFSEIQTTDLPIPDHIIMRVEQYRKDWERERKTAIIIKSLKIAGIFAIILLVLAGGTTWYIQNHIETTQSQNLIAAIKSIDIPAAETLLKEIETKYPRLSTRPKILQAKAALQTLKQKEQERLEEFDRLRKKLEELTKEKNSVESVRKALTSIENIARTDHEKRQVEDFKEWYKDECKRIETEANKKFLDYVALLKSQNEELLKLIEKKDFKQAEKYLVEIETIYEKINSLKNISSDIWKLEENLLKSIPALRNFFDSKKRQYDEETTLKKSILRTVSEEKNLKSIQNVLMQYQENAGNKLQQNEIAQIKNAVQELELLNAISNYQNKSSTIPNQFSKYPYFIDAEYFNSCKTKETEAIKTLNSTFDRLKWNTNKDEICFIRLESSDTNYIDLYVKPHTIHSKMGNDYRILMETIDEKDVTLIFPKDKYGIHIDNIKILKDNEKHYGYRLGYPQIKPGTIVIEAIRQSKATHQQLIDKFYTKLNTTHKIDIFDIGFDFIQQLIASETCAPYWKMMIILRIAETMAEVDCTVSGEFIELRDEMQKLRQLNDMPDAPLNNKKLASKINLFFKGYNISDLRKNIEENKKIRDFYSTLQNYKLQYAGIIFQLDGKPVIAKSNNLTNSNSEIFCFDMESGKCFLAGEYHDGEIIIKDQYQNQLHGKVFFYLTGNGNYFYNNMFYKLGDTINNIKKLPTFWMLNL